MVGRLRCNSTGIHSPATSWAADVSTRINLVVKQQSEMCLRHEGDGSNQGYAKLAESRNEHRDVYGQEPTFVDVRFRVG